MGDSTTRRAFLAGAAGVAAVAATPHWARAADEPFACGVASGDPLADRVIIWTHTNAAPQVAWEVRARSRLHQHRPPGPAAASGGQRLHGARRRRRAQPGHDVLVPLPCGRGDQPRRPHAHLARAGSGRRPAPRRRRDLRRMGVRLLRRLSRPGRARRHRRRARARRLHLRVRHDLRRAADAETGRPHPRSRTTNCTPSRTTGHATGNTTATPACSICTPVTRSSRSTTTTRWLTTGGATAARHQHPADEGDFDARRDAGLQAFREWMPIRVDRGRADQGVPALQFGNLVDLFMLDERLYRDEQPTNAVVGYLSVDPATDDPDRTMLGATQRDWFLNGLGSTRRRRGRCSATRWR